MAGPLRHLRVLDCADIRGALAARILADLGADVLKVELGADDVGRSRGPFAGGVPDPDGALAFLYRNANKRGCRISGDAAQVGERLSALAGEADLVVENLPEAERTALGLLPELVRERFPALIHVIVADFGRTGPRAGWRLEALPALAASGALFASGFADLPPCGFPGYLAHDCGSLFAVVGALAAVHERARTGRGQTVEVSVQEAAMHALHPWAIPAADYARRYPALPAVAPRNADGAYWVLATADGFVRALPASPRQWRGFVELLGAEALAGPEWEAPLQRLLNADVIRLLATDALGARPRADVLAAARRLDVPMVPVNTPDEFVAEAQTIARRFFAPTGFPIVGEAPFARPPFHLSATPASLDRPAPARDQRAAGFRAPRVEGSGGVADAMASEPVLAGVRVVDLGVGVAGPEIGCLLAELGAEVVKIESRANLDFLRRVTVEPDAPDRSWTFNDASRGQRSVCLDLATAEGRALALDLCARADVVVENNRGGVARRFGLDYASVRARNPGVVYYVSQAFGRGGPLGETSAFGPLNSAFAGVTWLWNHPNAPYPGGTALNHPDHTAAKLAAGVILAALDHRRRTGEGQEIEMSQAESAAYLMGEAYLHAACVGEPLTPIGNASPWAAPHGVYPCTGADRWVAIAVASDDDWRRCRPVMGLPDDPGWRTAAGRLAARRALDAAVGAWTAEREADDVAERLQAAGVSAMPVQNGDDHRADAHLASRGAIVTVEHPDIGPERHVGSPLRFSGMPVVPAGRAPLLGEHTADVLSRWLGLDADAVHRLETTGVCR